MLLSSLALVFLPIVLAQNSRTCLPSGDEKPINEELSKGKLSIEPVSFDPMLACYLLGELTRHSGGSATTVQLCPGSTHILHEPILFTSSRQSITTEGNPKGRDRAMLVVKGMNQSVAIKWV